ncbi:MAG: hypothetical protein IKH11_11055 [Bacteroidales bacterium]|nr:hypothetical protein [Bacteroidales bacterium]
MQDFGQLGRREAIRQLFEGSSYSPFEACTARPGADEKVAGASRLLLEGIDFDLVYFPLKHLGYKSVMAVTGELYAGLASPYGLSVRLGISAKLGFEQIKELWGGVLAGASESGYKSVDLDLQPSRNGLSISVSAMGIASTLKQPEPASKDLLCISGALGAAFCGLKLLEQGKTRFEEGAKAPGEELEKYRMLVAAYLKPELPAGLPEELDDCGIRPSAALLVDRGLADAMLRLVTSTGLGAKVYADKIPFEAGTFALGKEMNFDPVSAAMNGGEDFRILLAVPISQFESFRRDFQSFDIIGHLAQKDVGAVLVSPDGLEHKISAPGWPAEDDN